jgi:hypothetical protein
MNGRYGWRCGPGALWVAALALAGVGGAAAPWVIYETDFEPPLFTSGFTLDGQDNWLAAPFEEAHTSAIRHADWYDQGQFAVIGEVPPDSPTAGSVSVYRPLEVDPVARGTPMVGFSVTMSVLDSTDNRYNCFRWVVYNRKAERLFALDFDNFTLEISYLLDDDEFYPTGWTFEPDGLYQLVVTMNFAANRWSAELRSDFASVLLVNAAPLTTRQRTLDLGDIDAAWVLRDQGDEFGNNFLLFDNFKVVADTAVPLASRVEPVQFLGDGSFLLQLFGEPGRAYAIDVSSDLLQWTALTTNTPTDGRFVFLDAEAADYPVSFYRGRAVWP